ncbi:MAG: hypothetical protein Q4C87_05515 [Actinomycetaceae bacterium]|nr:hypothetical protein [Actinomycetaceae bacterium]
MQTPASSGVTPRLIRAQVNLVRRQVCILALIFLFVVFIFLFLPALITGKEPPNPNPLHLALGLYLVAGFWTVTPWGTFTHGRVHSGVSRRRLLLTSYAGDAIYIATGIALWIGVHMLVSLLPWRVSVTSGNTVWEILLLFLALFNAGTAGRLLLQAYRAGRNAQSMFLVVGSVLVAHCNWVTLLAVATHTFSLNAQDAPLPFGLLLWLLFLQSLFTLIFFRVMWVKERRSGVLPSLNSQQ